MLKIWIVGAGSQVGTAINEVIDPLEMEVFNTGKEELDITDTDAVINFGELSHPDVIINCAAMTNIKECEENKEAAYKVNALGARNLCIVARKIGAKIVQLSTDDVFDGKSQIPYTEFDETNPSTVYGLSKKAGESYVKEFTHKHFIIRSNWVYAKCGNNFVNNILNKSKDGKDIVITRDQIGSPTSAKDLARLILHLIKTNEYGTYHATCKGTCSRFEFAKEIINLSGKTNNVIFDDTTNGDCSVRPDYAVLDNFILRIIDVFDMPSWKNSLKEYIDELKEEKAIWLIKRRKSV